MFHHIFADRESKETCNLSDGAENSVWFIDLETSPSWIQNLVTKAKWMKGKLVCPKCQGRLGSFDFIKTLKCPCLNHKLPSIHILKARVDAETPNLQLISNSQDIHWPIKIWEILPMAKTEEDSQSFQLYRTWPRSDIQKDDLPVRALEVHSGSCFGTTCAAKVENQEQMSLMDHNLRGNSVLGGVNLQNEESSALRGIDLLGRHQESNAVNLSKTSLDKNTDVCRNKNTIYYRVERSNSSINMDTSKTTNYLMQNRTGISGDNSGNQSISGSIEDVLIEQDLYSDLPSSSSTTRRRKDRRKNRFTVLQDQTPSEVHSASSTKQEDDTQAVLVIPEENLCSLLGSVLQSTLVLPLSACVL
ncbi:hypothetical protein CHS0354_038037 [Potamilus streckersoni]|uniref:Uncharacterized protein n=1 Tax=Potamilus streckersoni TaxID=2493646 RepID=A0AAE0W1C8_9BIVA|nr:hypothetical protein CHS0354_038037 [Potamilus streckersoni]